MNWQMIFRLDTWGHMTGSFFCVWFFWWVTPDFWVAHVWVCAALAFFAGICNEVYQWTWGESYPLKKQDTVKDLIMNAIGITLAVVAIRGGK